MDDDDDDGCDDVTSITDDEADDAAWYEDFSPVDNSDTSGNLPDDGD